MRTETFHISIIVPVYNNPADLEECLSALLNSSCSGLEILVVDDASTDDSAAVASSMGVRVLRLAKNSGPAAARNYGARHARGEILLFVDADVVIAAGAIDRILAFFETHQDVAAVFGSYDALPRATGIVSRYRNLLHHFVHQHSNPQASTFWAGCGAIRRQVFDTVGGFDEQRYPRPSIEDIELGYRLRRSGYRIRLDKGLQGTHLKRWTLRSVVWTDIRNRAIPWARLILERKNAPNDLNLKPTQRLSGSLVMLASPLVPAGLIQVELLAVVATALLTVGFLNRKLYGFFFRQHGVVFAGVSILLHLLYFLYSGISYLYVWFLFHLESIGAGQSKAFQKDR